MPLKSAGRANPEQFPHPEPQIECACMDQQALQHVLVAAHMRASQPTGLVQMSEGPFQQLSAPAEQPFATDTADAPSIRIDRVPFGFLIRPVLAAAIRFTEVGANL